MSFVYASFLKRPGEGLLQFDNRVLHMLPVVAGTVFFDMCNYVRESGEFRVYIEWKTELTGMLQDRLPSGGYFVKATAGQAEEFDGQTDGIPVYMKLIAKEGRLYPYRTYVMWNGRPFSVEFNGNRLIPVDYKAKAAGREQTAERTGTPKMGSEQNAHVSVMQKPLAGSQNEGQTGSQRNNYAAIGQVVGTGSRQERWTGSQSFLLGSGGLYEWFRSSERRAYGGSNRSFMVGSERGYLVGSNRSFLMGSSYGYLFGSQNFMYGISSQNFWQTYLAWMGGSNRTFLAESKRGYLTGSNLRFFVGSGVRYLFGSQSQFLLGSGGRYEWFQSSEQSYLMGSRRMPLPDCRKHDTEMNEVPTYWQFLPLEWQLINRFKRPRSQKGGNGMFGYGLDLIDV